MIECSPLGDFDEEHWEQVEQAFAAMTPLQLGQAWLPRAPADFAAGQVRLGWRPDALHVFATLHDADIFSNSTADGQAMWRLGDVFEIFARVLPEVTWYEFHVTPNNHHLELCWPHDPQTSMQLEEQRGYEAFITPHPIISSRVRVDTERQCWQVLARVPAARLSEGGFLEAGRQWLVSFCRYDAWRDGRPEVLSSTSPFKKVSFSRQQEWSRLLFVGGESPRPASF